MIGFVDELSCRIELNSVFLFRSPDGKRDHDDDRRGRRERRRSPSRSR